MDKKITMSKGFFIGMILLGSIGIGMICTSVITCIAGGFNETIMRNFIWLVASALYGLVSYLIFSSEKLKLPVATALHCVICMAITFTACRFCRFPMEDSVWWMILVAFVMVYAVIYLAISLAARAEVKKINDKINKGK